MKKTLCMFLFLASLVGGCSGGHYYQAVFLYPGVDPQDLVWFPEGGLQGVRDTSLLRSVAEDGKLTLLLHSRLSPAALEKELSTLGSMPVDCLLESVGALPDGLPPKPKVVQRSVTQFVLKRDAAAAAGVSYTEVVTAIRAALTTKDVREVLDSTLQTKTGKRVRIGDLVEVVTVQRPSHVVRDHY